MTYCDIIKSALVGTVLCPSSKSYTHRAIFLASMAQSKGSTIRNMLRSADTYATINACRALGATFEIQNDTAHVTNVIPIKKYTNDTTSNDLTQNVHISDTKHNSTITINAENSGTTIRIAAGIAALLDACVTLVGDKSLNTRPMQPLLDALSHMGATCRSSDNGRPPLEICGSPILGGDINIHGDISSQFITSLFLCAPKTKSGINVTITGNMVSKPYLDATIGAMRKFGATVNTQIPYKKYHIAPQRIARTDFTVPFDASSLALLLAASALNDGNITIRAHMGTLPQGDEVFIDMLEVMGVRIEILDSAEDDKNQSHENDANAKKYTGETIHIHTNKDALKGGKFDLSNSPDLLPPLAIMSLRCKEPIIIENVGHARLKETDRIAMLARELSKIGIKTTEYKDGIRLEGPCTITDRTSQFTPENNRSSITLNSDNDHRLFMALCIAGLYVGNCTISDPDSVSVSYPKFIEDMRSLGAKIRIR